jgi:hypothetical protein
MPAPKRKHAESPTPPSSSFLTSKDVPNNDNQHPYGQDHEQDFLHEKPRSARKLVKAASGRLSEVPGLASPGSTGTSVESQGRLRKKYRLEKYYEEMAILNRSFVEYCKQAKHNILYKLENSLEILPEDEDFTEEAQQYIDHAARIKRRWTPTTGDVLVFWDE